MNKIFLSMVLSFIFLVILPCYAFAKSPSYKIVEDPKGVFIVEIEKNKLVPYVVDELITNKEVLNKTGARLVVNAGFFDPKNQKTVSYVVIDSKEVLNPKDNENLIQNKVLEPYMDKILNRSEFRILQDKDGKIIYDIVPHNEPVSDGLLLKHSIQAGPMLFPELRLEEEFFILVKDGKIVSESASALHKYARTAIGIKDNKVYIFIVTNDSRMNLAELADLTRKWGMQKSMAFDGGGSTSLDTKDLHIYSETGEQARKLKSFLILK